MVLAGGATIMCIIYIYTNSYINTTYIYISVPPCHHIVVGRLLNDHPANEDLRVHNLRKAMANTQRVFKPCENLGRSNMPKIYAGQDKPQIQGIGNRICGQVLAPDCFNRRYWWAKPDGLIHFSHGISHNFLWRLGSHKAVTTPW